MSQRSKMPPTEESGSTSRLYIPTAPSMSRGAASPLPPGGSRILPEPADNILPLGSAAPKWRTLLGQLPAGPPQCPPPPPPHTHLEHLHFIHLRTRTSHIHAHIQYTCDPCTYITLPAHTHHEHCATHFCTPLHTLLAPHPHTQTLPYKNAWSLTGVSKGYSRMRRQDKDAKEGCGSRDALLGRGGGGAGPLDRGCGCPGDAGWGGAPRSAAAGTGPGACPSEPAARPQPVEADTHPHPAMHTPHECICLTHTRLSLMLFTHVAQTHIPHILALQAGREVGVRGCIQTPASLPHRRTSGHAGTPPGGGRRLALFLPWAACSDTASLGPWLPEGLLPGLSV